MASSSIPQVKKIIRGVSMEKCRALAEQALASTSYHQVNFLMENWMKETFPSG